MISPLRFPKIGAKINAFAAILIIITILSGDFYDNIAPKILIFAIALYAIIGPIYIKKTLSEVKKT